jgi:hypothetical protein
LPKYFKTNDDIVEITRGKEPSKRGYKCSSHIKAFKVDVPHSTVGVEREKGVSIEGHNKMWSIILQLKTKRFSCMDAGGLKQLDGLYI